MHTELDFDPGRLAVFLSHPTTGFPVTRCPVYAEVEWTPVAEPSPAARDDRFRTALLRALALADADCANDPTYAERIADALARAMPKVLTAQARDVLLHMAFDELIVFLRKTLDDAIHRGGGRGLDDIRPEALQTTLEAALREAGRVTGLDLAAAEDAPVPGRQVSSYPLGLLATDHVGYLSFDLARLPAPVRAAIRAAVQQLADHGTPPAAPPAALLVYPLGLPALRFDALLQRRLARDAVVARVALDLAPLPTEVVNLGLLAMQTPGLTDWRLSPGSFAANPSSLIGADGCEAIVPANVALLEFTFSQVIGLSSRDVGLPLEGEAVSHVRPGLVNEYRVTFMPLGHSLGQILYSFPLGPGESANFTVVDWSRSDAGARTEDTKVSESLFHELHRDRSIAETIKASIEEWQRGGSLMAGVAGSAGSAAGASAGQGGGAGAALGAVAGVAGGVAAALGGAYSTSSGSRDIAANTLQSLSDNIVQAASSARELYSTVVVQTTQTEKENISTRTIVNYNHSHALTILYYEILRHYRIVVEFVRRRPAILTNIHRQLVYRRKFLNRVTLEVDQTVLRENRSLLLANLLDARHAGAFDDLDAAHHRELVKRAAGIQPPAGPPPVTFHFFDFEITTGGMVASVNEDDEAVWITCDLVLSGAPGILKLNNGARLNNPGSFTATNSAVAFSAQLPGGAAPVPWTQLQALYLTFELATVDDASVAHIRVFGRDATNQKILIVDAPYENGHLIMDRNTTITLPVNLPPPPPPPTGRPQAEIEEEARIEGLLDHIRYHRGHYERVLALGEEPASRATDLAGLEVGGGAVLLEKVDNRPLEVLGDFVAYPCVDPEWSEAIASRYRRLELPDPTPIERLATLPTRGVFAEAKLGHCNASEEIDPTRFWDWQTSPIPHLAPEIAPATPIDPKALQLAGLDPTELPKGLVALMTPPAAPDPNGMAAALTALATASIFRDMSGRAELADVLKKLADTSVAIAQVAQGAATGATKAAAPAPQDSGAAANGQPHAPAAGAPHASNQPSGGGTSGPTGASPPSGGAKPTDGLQDRLDIANQLPPADARPIRQAVGQEAAQQKRPWRITLKSDWQGPLQAPLDATFWGLAFFNTTTNEEAGTLLPDRSTNKVAIWEKVEHTGVLTHVEIRARDIKPVDGSLTVSVPGLALDGVNLVAKDYKVDLRKLADRTTADVAHVVYLDRAKINEKTREVNLVGTLALGSTTIKATIEMNEAGELTGELGAALGGEENALIEKLSLGATLKAGAKVTVGGKQALEGAFEVVYVKGFTVALA